MGIQTALQSLHWPVLLTAVAYIFSTSAHLILTKLVMSVLLFRFPVTLSLIQTISTSISLVFWAVFGLFKLRPIPLKSLLQLAFPTAIVSLLTILSLRHNSLLIFQSVRMLAMTLVQVIRPLRPHPPTTGVLAALPCSLLGLFILAWLESGLSGTDALLATCSLAASVGYHLVYSSHSAAIRATELQYQLALKSATAVCMLPFVPLFEHHFESDNESLYDFVFDEGATLLIFSTGLLAFFSFSAARASLNRMSLSAFHNAVYTVAVVVFFAHFVIMEFDITCAHMLGIGLVLAGNVLSSASVVTGKHDLERSRSFSETDFSAAFSRSGTIHFGHLERSFGADGLI